MRRNRILATRPQGHKVIGGFLLVACSLLLVVLLSGCAKKEIKNLDSAGKNMICFGDSLTFGYGASTGEDYPAALAKMLGTAVINAGIDGDTTVEGIRRFDSDVLQRNPLLVIIEFGGNDFLRKIPTNVTASNIKEMARMAQEKGAMVALVDISAGLLMREYRAAFYKAAQETGSIFVPGAFNGIITNPHLKSDFIHPNANGYQVIAQRIYRVILPYLNQNKLLRKNQK